MPSKQKDQLLFRPDPNSIVDIPVSDLLLDSENPRLAWRTEGGDQEGLIKLLWSEMAVDEVAFSIAANGFFRSEPLFVIPSARKYTVIEGNRRLAAVLLLRDPQLRARIGATDLPQPDPPGTARLASLPAMVFPDRESLWTTVGFRHINGIKPWDSFSKAKYIAQVRETYDIPLEDIAARIGDRHATVVRLYRGIKVLQQAEKQAGFSPDDTYRGRFYFSHLYTATDQREFQEFIGIEPRRSLEPNPVPRTKLKELAELMTYLYGKKSAGKEPVVRTQNPDLNILRQVIASPEGLAVLRSGYPLDRAYQVTIGDKRRFRDALVSAKVELQNAKATVTTGYQGEKDLFRTMDDILRLAESVSEEMKTKMA